MSDATYRGRHRAPAARHRAATSTPRPTSRPPERTSSGRHLDHASAPSGFPRLAKSGYLLPTAAAAALALTASGTHIGVSSSSASSGSATAAMTATSIAGADPIERDLQDRAARDSSRDSLTGADAGTGTDAVPDAEATDQQVAADRRRAAIEARAAAQAQAAADAAAQAAVQAAAQAQAAQEAAAKAQADAATQAKAPADAVASANSWVAPIAGGYTLTSGFGMRWGSMHPGQDFAIPTGTPIKAMSSGTVILAGWSGGYGNKVEIQYTDGTVSWYAHNSQLKVTQGAKVSPGQVVALSGNTGHSTGPHLHLEIHPNNGSPVPPLPWLNKMGAMP